MKPLLFFFTALSFLLSGFATAHDSTDVRTGWYHAARQELARMLAGNAPLSYERALFCIENAFHSNGLDSLHYRHTLDRHTRHIRGLMEANRDAIPQRFRPGLSESMALQQNRYEKALANWAIFTYMTDTTYIGGQYAHLPFSYSFQDPLGTLDWTHTQVTALLSRGTGNCFALASLFRIFSERLDSEAALCTAPGHIYIRHADHKGIYYNVEAATRSFPGTGSIATLTYTSDEAISSGIALRALDTKQSVALCLVYLAKGYLYGQPAPDDTFAMDCAELALHYDSLCLSALLLKAEALENRLLRTPHSPDLQGDNKDFAALEFLTRRLYQLGYRQMPLSMKEIIIGRLRKDSTAIRIGATDHTPRPFREISPEPIPYASLSWGRLEEMHADKPAERYGRTLFDTRSGTITGFAGDSVFFNDYFFDPVVFAWQIDPLAHKYPSLSPYHAFANNPILYVDEDGRENTIYLVIATDRNGKPSISKETAKEIENKANEYFKLMGLNTTVIVYNETNLGNFNLNNTDLNDGYVVIGTNRESIINKVSSIDKDFSDKLQVGWTAKFNPEKSNLNSKGIVIDYLNIEEVQDKFQGLKALSQEEFAALSIVHGAGHNSGVMKANGDHLDSGIMGDLSHQEAVLRNYGKEGAFDQFIFNLDNPNNEKYGKGIRKTFEWKAESNDNYIDNKVKNSYPQLTE